MRPANLQRFFIALCVIIIAGCGTEAPPAGQSPLNLHSVDLLERGQYLARAGNCVGCHTPAGAPEFSGGKAITTPFGIIYSSNLTADNVNGLGGWDSDDFWQAMHHGKSADGSNLYPAFPYPNYTLMTRDDSDALFAYFQTIPAVDSAAPDHELRFPFNTQLALSAWRLLFFKPQTFQVNSDHNASWNRGSYLVKGLGHCGACHTPRGVLGSTRSKHELAGAYIDHLGWDALSLLTGPVDAQQKRQTVTLLKTGVNERHHLSGPMAEVVFHSLQYVDEQHLDDMVEYMASLPSVPAQLRPSIRTSQATAATLRKEGDEIYVEHCSDCHGEEGQGEPFKYPALVANQGVTAESPSNAIRILKQGGFGASTEGRPRPYGMPAYAHQLNARESAAVLSYIRAAWGNSASAVSPEALRRD